MTRASSRTALPLDGMRFARFHIYPWHHKSFGVNRAVYDRTLLPFAVLRLSPPPVFDG